MPTTVTNLLKPKFMLVVPYVVRCHSNHHPTARA